MVRVYADIAGDLFHYGHVNFFKNLRKHGDYVIIGLHSDQDIFDYKAKYPILTIDERAAVIKGCKYVDEVWINTPVFLTADYIKNNKIDIIAHAHDATDKTYDEFYKIPIEMGIFRRLDYTPTISSSDIINRCRNHSNASNASNESNH
jgi:cytidyltransferase-like protein